MALRNELKNAAMALAHSLTIKDVRIGLCYTAVQLTDGRVGLAYTFRDTLLGGCSLFDDMQTFAGRPARELLSLFDSSHMIASALALATANALINTATQPYIAGPALEQIVFNPDDQVGMIGNFSPLVKEIRPRVKQLHIFERQARTEDNILEIAAADKILPQCQVALITATAIINGSIDHLLALAANCRDVVILGSSAPLCRDVFSATPVTLVSGVIVNNAGELLQIVSEGGGAPAFKRVVNKVNLSIDHSPCG